MRVVNVSAEEIGIPDAVDCLLAESNHNEFAERRVEPRFPFFAPVSGMVVDGDGSLFSAFSREISRSGIGLLHNMELKPGRVVITITSAAGTKFNMSTEILWCKPAGEGWFLSGGRFLMAARLNSAT
jgi:hypothetical protein